jgi:hypothetical protein
MTTAITALDTENHISHALFIDLTLNNTTYYLTSAYRPITYNGNIYQQQGWFLQVGSFTDDLKTTNGDIQVSLSGIPASQMSLVLNQPIKGGEIIIRRGFFDTETNTLLSGQMYVRYKGIITNYAIEENQDTLAGELTHTIVVSCASINELLENKVTGQRTNSSDRQRFYPGDISFDRVKDLQNTSFDFGKKYTGGPGYGGGGGGGGYPDWRNPDNMPELP